jgi:hypothetical protein
MNRRRFGERRRHERYQARKGAFVAPDTHVRKLWQILDISKGGLAFRYVVTGEDLDKCSALDILTADTQFFLEMIPVRCISDLEIVNESVSSYGIRRRSVEFGKLTPFQMSSLEDFIRNHAIESV